MSLFFDHEFEARITHHDVGSERYRYTVVYLPDALKEVLPLKQSPRLRISGEVNDYPFEAALTPVKGAWYILLSKETLDNIDARPGDVATIRFRIADQNAVQMPDALIDALDRNENMRDLWDSLTPGKQRGLAYLVASAKRDETKAKRVALVFDVLEGRRDMRGKPTK